MSERMRASVRAAAATVAAVLGAVVVFAVFAVG